MEDDVNELYLHYKTKFKATRIIGNLIYPTNFKLEADIWIDMENNSQEENDYNLNLTLMKVDFFFKNIIDNSILMSFSNSWATEFLIKDGTPNTENILVNCPLEPSDDHLAMLFQSKMTSLGKDQIVFGGVSITSDNSRGLKFTFVGNGAGALPDMEDWVGERSYFEDPWWLRDDASTFDVTPSPDADLTDKPDFAFDLDFLGQALRPIQNEGVSNNIVRPKFRPVIIRNEDESE